MLQADRTTVMLRVLSNLGAPLPPRAPFGSDDAWLASAKRIVATRKAQLKREMAACEAIERTLADDAATAVAAEREPVESATLAALLQNLSIDQLTEELVTPPLPLGTKVLAEAPTRSTERLTNGAVMACRMPKLSPGPCRAR